MRAFIDSDVLIWHLRGSQEARQFLKTLRARREYELWIAVTQRAEVVFFMRPEEEESTTLFLSQFKTAPLDQSLVDAGGDIFRRWHPSHGTDPNDALLAATAINTGGKVYTLNTKHFPMPDLVVERAWNLS